MSEDASKNDINNIDYNGTRYVRLEKKNWYLSLDAVALSRSTKLTPHSETDECLEGTAVVTAGGGAPWQIAMMDAPHAPSTEFQFVLSTGMAEGRETSVEARRRWPAEIQCETDPGDIPRRWCLYVDIPRPEFDKILDCVGFSHIQTFILDVYIEALFVRESEYTLETKTTGAVERTIEIVKGRTAYLLPFYHHPGVPKACGYVSSVEAVAQLLSADQERS